MPSAQGTNLYHIVQSIAFSESLVVPIPSHPSNIVWHGIILPLRCPTRRVLRTHANFHCQPAILYFDYFLTLPAEVDRYWTGSGWSWASFFFFVNRYMSIICHTPVIYEFFWPMPESVRLPVLLLW